MWQPWKSVLTPTTNYLEVHPHLVFQLEKNHPFSSWWLSFESCSLLQQLLSSRRLTPFILNNNYLHQELQPDSANIFSQQLPVATIHIILQFPKTEKCALCGMHNGPDTKVSTQLWVSVPEKLDKNAFQKATVLLHNRTQLASHMH